MRRPGGRRDAGALTGVARGGRGRPRTRDGARARAQENLRERSIEKVLEGEGWGVVPAWWRVGCCLVAAAGGCGADWRVGNELGKEGRWDDGRGV
jgi:hypothetical protein